MRGSEGLAKRIQSLYFSEKNTFVITNFQESSVSVNFPIGQVDIKQETNYPFDNFAKLTIDNNSLRGSLVIKVFIPNWIEEVSLNRNGKSIKVVMSHNYLILENDIQTGDIFVFKFNQKLVKVQSHGNNTPKNLFKIQYGPLVLGVEDIV